MLRAQGIFGWLPYSFIYAVAFLRTMTQTLAVKPYEVKSVFIDQADGSVCKSNEFTNVGGLAGHIWSHDPTMPTYRAGQQCFLTIQAPHGYRIVVQAVQFNLGYPAHPERCNGDSLFIFDNQPEDGKIFDSKMGMLGEFCESVRANEAPKTLAVSSNDSITLYWHAADASRRQQKASGFKLRWFVVRLAQDRSIRCRANSEFACSSSDSCIPAQLACDQEQHCADGSDLFSKRQIVAGCENVEPDSVLADYSGAAVGGVAVGVATVAVLVVVLVWRCCCSSSSSSASANRCKATRASVNNYRPAPVMAPARPNIKFDNDGDTASRQHDQFESGSSSEHVPAAAAAATSACTDHSQDHNDHTTTDRREQFTYRNHHQHHNNGAASGATLRHIL